MKETAVFGLLFFMIFSHISIVSAEENSYKIESIIFSRKLFYYRENKIEIDFINLNPIFFNDNKNYLLNYYAYIDQINNYQNNNVQNQRNVQSDTQENNLGLFLLRLVAESIAVNYKQNKIIY